MSGMHITKEAKNTTIDNCEFINCGIKNEGQGTKVIRTKFIRTFKLAKDWSQKWWGQIVVTIIAGLAVALITKYI